jgi:hypothetical protein
MVELVGLKAALKLKSAELALPILVKPNVRIGSYAAGGTGFEPAFRYNPKNRLAGGPIRPLWHPPNSFVYQAEGVGFEPTVP